MNESPTYQELLATNRRLVAENELLREENAKLSGLVKDLLEVDKETKNIEVISGHKAPKPVFQGKKIVAPCLSLEEKVSLFSSLFKGREDVFAKRWYSKTSGKSGYQPVCLNEWNPQLCNKKKYKCVQCPNRQFKGLEYDDMLEQWKSRLEEFLDIDYVEEDTSHKRGRKIVFSPFGTLDSNGNRLHGMVDVALM